DVYVVNTCTVTNIADRKSRQMLHKARKMNEAAVVIAVGCYVQTAGEVLEQDKAIDIVIGNNKKKDIIRILNEYYESNSKNINEKNMLKAQAAKIPVEPETDISYNIAQSIGYNMRDNIIDIGLETEYEDLNIESIAEKTRAYIKIQDGCNQFCSYCIIPYARGRARSRKEESIIAEVLKLVSKGYKEIVLTGIHLSSYGFDFKKNNIEELPAYETHGTGKLQSGHMENRENHLLQLIIKLSQIERLKRIRLGSLEPRIITEEFAKTLSDNTKLCPHFHLSLQSGCDGTLKRMNRKYSSQEYYEKCILLRKYFRNPAITTDVIVGFPGETDEEFDETNQFLRKISFAQMHIFKYSVRKGTKAGHMPDQIMEEVKTERSNILIDLESQMEKEYRAGFLNETENILIEEYMNINGENYQVGHNERYLKLAVKSNKNLNNQIIQGKITGYLNKEIMFCEIMD
ncbi:MAG: MiaB/RimO family radical SAM methylthiotransferase, partial [Anaerocolumna sp.]